MPSLMAGGGFTLDGRTKLILLAVAGLVIIATRGDPEIADPTGPSQQSREVCAMSDAKLREVMDSWKAAGIVLRERNGDLVVLGRAWPELDRKAKVTIALAQFCRPSNRPSYGSIRILDNRSYDALASMSDGHYFD